MPSTKRRKKATPKIGKEAWQIVGPDGSLLKETGYGEGPALIQAHRIAEREFHEPAALTVRLKPLFGEPDEFYRVVRCEDGSISTYPLR